MISGVQVASGADLATQLAVLFARSKNNVVRNRLILRAKIGQVRFARGCLPGTPGHAASAPRFVTASSALLPAEPWHASGQGGWARPCAGC